MLGSQGENQNQESPRTKMPMAESVGLSGQGGPGSEHDYGGERHNVTETEGSGHRYPGQASWQEPGPTAGYHGPMGRDFVSQGATVPASEGLHSDNKTEIEGNRESQYDHRRQESFGDVLDAYFDSEGDGHVVQDSSHPPGPPGKEEVDVQRSQPSSVLPQSIEDDMPNFDAQPLQLSNHKRGMSIENHLPGSGNALYPTNSNSLRQNTVQPIEPQQPRDFTAQVHRSRSQPDFRSRDQRMMATAAEGGAFEVAGDVPSTPAVPEQYTEQQYQANRYGYPSALPNNYGQPRGRGAPRFAEGQGPIRSQTLNEGQYYQQRPPPGPQQYPPGPYRQPPPGPLQRPPPDFRQQYPPGPRSPIHPGSRPQMPPGTRQQLPLRQRTNPGMPPAGPPPNSTMQNIGPSPARQPSSSGRFGNPDNLPQHPTPVRPGLMPGSTLRQASPPPPVRQYDNAGVTVKQGSPPSSATQMNGIGNRRSSIPVTYEELESLKRAVDANPGDQATQLLLAKKWVEAAAVLVDDGGATDMKTRNRAREKFIFDAHKLIKKLVSANYAEAMFYLADCYGRGLLGLEADQKEAFNLYQSAAKLGHASSAYRTAVCCEMGHEDGGGTRKDPLKAMQWYKKAATLGDTPAMYKMGIILLKGLLGQPKNPREAVVWLKRAAERADEENPHALHELVGVHQLCWFVE
jgi:Sel1 repeat